MKYEMAEAFRTALEQRLKGEAEASGMACRWAIQRRVKATTQGLESIHGDLVHVGETLGDSVTSASRLGRRDPVEPNSPSGHAPCLGRLVVATMPQILGGVTRARRRRPCH